MDNLSSQHQEQQQQQQNLEAIYAAQRAWRHEKLRERELRRKKKLARQANADQSFAQSTDASQPTLKRAKVYDQGAAQAGVYSEGYPIAPTPTVPTSFVGAGIRNDHQFQYTDVSGVTNPTLSGAATGAMVDMSNAASAIPAVSQGMYLDQEDAQRRWREQKLREIREKKAKGTPSKRGRRKGNGSMNQDQSVSSGIPASLPTSLAQLSADSAVPVSSAQLQSSTAGMMSISRQQMVYGVDLAQAAEQQLQGNTDTASIAALMSDQAVHNRIQREIACEVEGAFQDALGAAAAASMSGGDDTNTLPGDASGANTREAITAILASSGVATNIIESNPANTITRTGNLFARQRTRQHPGPSQTDTQTIQNGATGDQSGNGQEHFQIEGEEDIMTAATDWQSLDNINQS